MNKENTKPMNGDNGSEGNPGYFIPNNREGRRNTKKVEIRLRKKVAKAFDMMTKEEQANAYAAIMEATGKAQAELRRLQAEKEKHDDNTDDPGDDSIRTDS